MDVVKVEFLKNRILNFVSN